MPNCDLNSTKPVGGYKEVVIIGNGPSGLCLSYFLSGNWPYWNKTKVSDEYLQMRLEYCDNGLSLVEQDLAYLSDGLEGRSLNPVALLYDKLKHPDGDLGIDSPSCLNWKYDPLKEIDHVCIGKAAGPGGAWNDLDGSQLTISPSRWMELPDMSYSDWKRQTKNSNGSINAGLVFSAKNCNFSEDNSLLNGNYTRKPSINGHNHLNGSKYNRQSTEESRASMHDVRNYYRDYVKQKNLDKYLLNNATVTSVRRINCSKLVCQTPANCQVLNNSQAVNGLNPDGSYTLWEVTGLIDKRDRKKASSLTHKGDLMEFRFYCKHLVLANGATDLHNELHVKGERSRFILRSIKDLEDKIKEDLPRLQKDPLLIVGSGLSAADAILLAQKFHIRIINVIRRSVNDPNLIFNKLPKKIYPEYQRVYEQMLHNRYTNENTNNNASMLSTSLTNTSFLSTSAANISPSPSSANLLELKRQQSQTDLNDHSSNEINNRSFVVYDEHQIKCFTSKRTVILTNLQSQPVNKNFSGSNRHLHKQHYHHQRLKEFDEEPEQQTNVKFLNENDTNIKSSTSSLSSSETELKISYACVLIGFSPDLDFLPPYLVNDLAVNPNRPLDTKENPIEINEWTHESSKFKNLYAMGPLIGDNFVRFGTGGALAITSSINRFKKLEQMHRSGSSNNLLSVNKNTCSQVESTNSNTITNGTICLA